jgi:cell division protein FtsA
MKERIIVGLDVGTSKISSSVCKLEKNNTAKVLGISRVPCKGLKDGVVVDLDETIDSIEKAIEEVERQSETEVYTVIVNVNGGHIRGENTRGAVIIPEKENEVTKKMMDKAIDSAKMLALPLDRQFIHIIPQGYTVDGQEGIKNPLGMYATKLEVELYCIDGMVTLLQNVVKGVNMSGYEVGDLVFSPIAASYAVVAKEERELGVLLIDIGAGTAGMVVFIRGNIKDAVVVPGGGDKIIDNLSRTFRIPHSIAEELMRRFGCTQSSTIKDKERIYLREGINGKNSVSRQEFCKVIESDMRGLFEGFRSRLEKCNYKEMAASGVVITGGLALMDGVAELAEEVFGVNVRLGLVRGFENTGKPIVGPLYATTFGLIRYGIDQDNRDIGLDTKPNAIFKRITNRIRALYEEYF